MIKLEITDYEALQFLVWKNTFDKAVLKHPPKAPFVSEYKMLKTLNKIHLQIQNQIYCDHTVETFNESHIENLTEALKHEIRDTQTR